MTKTTAEYLALVHEADRTSGCTFKDQTSIGNMQEAIRELVAQVEALQAAQAAMVGWEPVAYCNATDIERLKADEWAVAEVSAFKSLGVENIPIYLSAHPEVAPQPAAQPVNQVLLEALKTLLPMVEEWHEEFPRDVGDKEAPAIKAARAAIAQAQAQPAVEREAQEADMFWSDDDAERNHNSIDEFLNEEICNGSGVEVGAVFTLRRASSLPKIKIRVTSIDDEACEAEWEIIDHGITKKAQP